MPDAINLQDQEPDGPDQARELTVTVPTDHDEAGHPRSYVTGEPIAVQDWNHRLWHRGDRR